MTTVIPFAGAGKEPVQHVPAPEPTPDTHGPFGRVVTAPEDSPTSASARWVTWLLFMVPLCIAELRGLSEPEIERVSARAADLIASHGDDAQYGGHHQRSARTAIAQGLAVLARADGGVTALGIHACVRPHAHCPGTSPAHSSPSKHEERDV
ncbi:MULTISPECIES: hypothetical protein [Streptomyces]|uniref:hypothetical protein n=1 Tax=Streptomyces TaxID=1883 RepID=UPI001F4087B0|nr:MULTISPECIES: hypothetical protein [Streptomyces]MDX3206263.1 hypothetical protein [Streptomyces scabiei]